MKKLLFAFCIMFLTNAHAQRSKDEQAIMALLNTQSTAWNKGDLQIFMQTYWKNDSLMFVGKNSITYGWQQTLDNYKKGYPDKAAMGHLTFGIKKVEILGRENAFVVGSWHLKRANDEPHGHFNLLLKKIEGQWKIVVDHSS